MNDVLKILDLGLKAVIAVLLLYGSNQLVDLVSMTRSVSNAVHEQTQKCMLGDDR